MWNYGHSLEISQKPPELNEFSQQLRVRIEIQKDQFPKPIKTQSKWTIDAGRVEDFIKNLRSRVAKK